MVLPRLPKGKGAFTLVEVIISMAIFTMVIAGGILGVQKGFEFVDNSRHYTRSSQVLQSELELLRTLPWATFSALDNATLTDKFNEQIVDQFGEGTYAGLVKAEAVSFTSSGVMSVMKVQVSVSWTQRNGRTASASYATYFSDGGLNDYYAH